MVRNSNLIFCLCVCFWQYHISVSLYTHLYTHIIKLLHGWFVCTIFIIHSLWRIAKLTRSLRSLVRLTILHNSWIKIVRTHQPWIKLYLANGYDRKLVKKYMKKDEWVDKEWWSYRRLWEFRNSLSDRLRNTCFERRSNQESKTIKTTP